MKLESLPKFYAPKSANFSGVEPATDGDRLTITDVMAAQGFVQSKESLGFFLFLAKIGVHTPDPAIELLAEIAEIEALHVHAIQALPARQRAAVLHVIAVMAYQDYSRSAASARPCGSCGASGFIDAEVFTTKIYRQAGAPRAPLRSIIGCGNQENSRVVCERVRVICRKCNGKGIISNACRCQGRGYSRLKFSAVLAGLR